MRELSLFTGAGGGLLGSKLLGWTAVGYVENNEYCQKVLRQRIADGILDAAPIFVDIRKFISDGYADTYKGMVDVVTGGFPCQDISIAGKGAGIGGERSGLWSEMASIIGTVRPQFVFVENSPMLTIRGLGRVLADLARMGFQCRHGVLGGYTTGRCADGKRIWIFADASNSKRWFAPQIQIEKFNSEWASRRQFDRAISACSCEEAHAKRLRDIDGMARDMDRIKALGNGQVPVVAKTAWEILSGGK